MPNTEEKILQAASDTITAKAIDFTVDIREESWLHGQLQKYGIKPKKKGFKLKPLTVGNAIRVSKLAVGLSPVDKPDVSQLITLISSNGDKMAEALAIAIRNKEKYPSKRFIRFLKFNLSPKEMELLLTLCVEQMGIEHFLNTTFLIRGMNILEKKKETSQEKGPSVPGNESDAM